MSRIGKKAITVPAGVTVDLLAGGAVSVKGKNGALQAVIHPLVQVNRVGDELLVTVKNDVREAREQWGTARQILFNMVKGVSEGFEKKLSLVGVGYKASVSVNKLNLVVGYSHPVDIVMPEGVTVQAATPTEILLKGCDKQRLGQIAAEIRLVRAPEPYKGKGIRYSDERVVRKETKKK